MNKIFVFIFLFIFSFFNSYSQSSTENSFEIFWKKNLLHYKELSTRIQKLPINACKTKNIKVTILIDSTGTTLESKILSGTTNTVIDNLILKTIYELEGKWIPFFKDGTAKLFLGEFNFSSTNIYSKKFISSNSQKITHGINYDRNKNCEDNEYYYKKGIESYKNEKYKLAKYNFTKALSANKYDIDSQFNLGMSFLKLEKIEKACECFKKLSNYGDSESINIYNTNCN